MKKILLTLLTLLVCINLSALPAKPGKVKYVQPDGTTLLLELHGDAHNHWYTNEAGQKVEKDKDGFWRPVLWTPDWKRVRPKGYDDDDDWDDDDWDWDDDDDDDDDDEEEEEEEYEPITTGERHFPVILVNYTDVKFTIEDPVQMMWDMLNKKGYSHEGATGSVRDYYYENSHGIFEPVFDVYGPYELEHDMAYYGEDIVNSFIGRDDLRAAEVLYEGFMQLAQEEDVSRYDSNGDGKIDMVLIFYAGYNQAEHGPVESIWPHAEEFPYLAGHQFEADGVRVGRYFMTSELRSNTGNKICGIGAPAHEFSHALGLPDFYDTDYADHGQAGGMYSFSIMANGCYNNESMTPPYLSSEERIMLGWMDEEDALAMPNGNVRLDPVNQNKAFRSYTDMDGEYFVYEYRSKTGWDAWIPEGLLVYHVDKSKQIKLGVNTPHYLWYQWERSNAINAYAEHPCCYVIAADDQSCLYYNDYKANLDKIIFPGSKSVTQYTPVDWVGSTTGVSLSGISANGGAATWKADVNIQQRLMGKVTSSVGVPIPGAKVIVHPLEPATDGIVTAVADAEGNYEAILTGKGWEKVSVRASAQGYASSVVPFELSHPRKNTLSLQLVRLEDADNVEICYITEEDEDESNEIGHGSIRVQYAMYVPAQDLDMHVGKQIKQVRFKPACFLEDENTAEIFIEDGEQELVRVKDFDYSESKWYTVDVREYNLFVEKGKSYYVGWQLGTPDYGFTIYPGTNLVKTSEVTSGVAHQWETIVWEEGVALACKLVLGEEAVPNPYAARNINTIQQNDSYKAGDLFEFLLVSAQEDKPSKVTWTFDGAAFEDGDAVQLEAGRHHVEVVLVYPDGRREILETELDVD
jgi:M6 family metalloprotease-like protein